MIERATQVAQAAHLRAYDAVYIALALNQRAAFLTLDPDVRRKVTETYPELSLVALGE
ncbi:MAG: DUF429 domain-containing protein [Deltaproteobacteria bacterium]|nr:DUF429 domain-containing protein [Deltaproteobacteria bacterium]